MHEDLQAHPQQRKNTKQEQRSLLVADVHRAGGTTPGTIKRQMITRKQINKAISHLDLEVIGNGDGYFYFVCKRTESTIGSSCLWPRLNDVSLDRWLAEAEAARQSGIVDGSALEDYEKLLARYGANWTLSASPKEKICVLPEHG